MDIVVLAGGTSTERNVSLSTGTKVCQALIGNGHRAVLLDVCEDYYETKIQKEAIFSKAISLDAASISEKPLDKDFLERLKNRREYFGEHVLEVCKLADIVFIALHGENGENGKLQACFDLHKIKYTGGDYLSCAIAMNKLITRRVLIHAGVRMPDGYALYPSSKPGLMRSSKFGYPAVVKAANGGSSIGVFIVKNDEEYENAVRSCFEIDNEIVVEKYIKGREFSVGVLGEQVLPVIEIAPVTGFYDYKNKYQKGMAVETCPADLPKEVSEEMREIAGRVAEVLGSKVYSRSDYLMDEDGVIYCLESNSLPGMTPTSLVPQEAAAVGMSYDALCEKIIELSLQKYR